MAARDLRRVRHPAVGAHALSKYSGYHSGVDPSIINEWTTVAFRFGHDQASNESPKQLEDGTVTATVDLKDNFSAGIFGQTLSSSADMDQWIRGEMTQQTQEIDGKVSNAVRDTLFGFAGFDLAALDVGRGDDHGVGNYNILRNELGLSTYHSIAQFAKNNGVDAATKQALIDTYGGGTDSQAAMDTVDSQVGGLLEKHAKGSMLGQTFTILNVEQFENTRDGDKFWYENRFKGDTALLNAIDHTSLADLIARNTGIQYIYHDAFAAAARIGGGAQADTLPGTNKGDLLLGFANNDTIHGNGGDDDAWGGADNDNVYGDGGNDRVYGEAGNDNVYGGGGNDIVSGGAGNDNLWGNGGRDTFDFVDGGNDHIKDFAKNEQIDLSEYAQFQKFADVREHMTQG